MTSTPSSATDVAKIGKTLSTGQFLAISPFVIYGILAILVFWTFRYNRGSRKRSTKDAILPLH